MNDSTAPAPWFSDEYCRIERCRFDDATGKLSVTFADGQVVDVNPLSLVPEQLREVDWWRVASSQYELIVPYADGWYEVPWDVIRMLADPAFDAHMSVKPAQVDAGATAH